MVIVYDFSNPNSPMLTPFDISDIRSIVFTHFVYISCCTESLIENVEGKECVVCGGDIIRCKID